MNIEYVEKVIAKKTNRIRSLVKDGMGVSAAKETVLKERELVGYTAKEIIRRRINALPPESLKPPRSFLHRLFGL